MLLWLWLLSIIIVSTLSSPPIIAFVFVCFLFTFVWIEYVLQQCICQRLQRELQLLHLHECVSQRDSHVKPDGILGVEQCDR